MLNPQNTQGESRYSQTSATNRQTSPHKRGRKPHRKTQYRPNEPAAQ